jgi:hypothetical protein
VASYLAPGLLSGLRAELWCRRLIWSARSVEEAA